MRIKAVRSVAISSNGFSWRYALADPTPSATAVAAVEIAPCADSHPSATAVAAVAIAPCADSTPPATAVAAVAIGPSFDALAGPPATAAAGVSPPTTVGTAHFVAILLQAPLHLLLGLFTGIAIFLLHYTDQFVLLTPDLVEVVSASLPHHDFSSPRICFHWPAKTS